MGNILNLTLKDFGIDEKKFIKNRKVIEIDGMIYEPGSKLVDDVDVYEIDLMPSSIEDVKDGFFKEKTAYIADSEYYLYRGEADSDDVERLKPGIYLDTKKDKETKYFIIKPTTDEEKEKYSTKYKISKINKMSLIDSANSNAEILIAIPESTKIFQPEITENDDILKVIAKKALLIKNIDLDRYRDRFSNKNELFNFKQVLRSDNKLSMKIFTRGMEAMNLVFTIIITEKSDNNVVGNRLEEPIVTSSEETYPMSA